MALIDQLKEEQKLAMKAKDKLRLGTIRLALAAISNVKWTNRLLWATTTLLPY